jgi:GNAT superfamily N-acetyltransferase
MQGVTRVRKAQPADAEEVVRVVNAAYRGAQGAEGSKAWTTEEKLVIGPRLELDMARRILTEGAATVLVAEKDGRVVGTVQVTPEAAAGYIGLLSVDPTLQTGGLGKLLLQHAEEHIRDVLALPVARMRVFEERSELEAFYLRRGYVKTGDRVKAEKLGMGERIQGELHFIGLEKKLV